MLVRVTKVKPLQNFELELEFSNKEIKIIDMKPYLDLPIFKELTNNENFSKVKVAFGTLQWENGADFDPDSLYNLSKKIEKATI